MSGIRSFTRRPSQPGYATKTSCPVRVDDPTNVIFVIPAGSGTTEIALPQMITASGTKMAAGNAAFVTGAATIATGLTTVQSFQYNLLATGFATGATEITDAVVSSITTGSVVLQGYRLQTTTASASGTGTFYWFAVGT